MLIGQLQDWPPMLKGHPVYEGTFLGCDFVPATATRPACLDVHFAIGGDTYTVSFWHSVERILKRVCESLKASRGITMLKTGDMELVELAS